MKKKEFIVFADGGARGNPGPAAVGFVIRDSQGKVLVRQKKQIGWATNNVAEYTAVIEALKWFKNNLADLDNLVTIKFYLDSSLVVNQLNGFFKIKNKNLQKLIIEIRKIEREIKPFIFYYRKPREKNKEADFLVNQALNEK